MTDVLRMLTESLARFGGGSYTTARYADIIDRRPPDTRTPEEKFYDTIDRLGFVVVDDGSHGGGAAQEGGDG